MCFLVAALLDKGWRRSGMTVYKPDMRRTCCPTYTIRLEADAFSPSKDQARVLHRMQRCHDFCSPLLEALNFRDSFLKTVAVVGACPQEVVYNSLQSNLQVFLLCIEGEDLSMSEKE
jgi:arginyl-tRNA--protein-N-Asp/Glu arginylyltransferase